MRICFIAGTLGQGGAERQLYYNLKCLTECGVKVDLLTLGADEHWEAPMRELGVAIHFVGGKASRISRLLHILKAVHRLRPQVVQCQHFYTGIYGGVAGRFLRICSVGAVRSDGLSELNLTGPFMRRFSCGLPNWLLANSQRAIENLQSRGVDPNKLLLLPNAVDTEWFKPGERRHSQEEFVILGVGSLEIVKRFDRLLEIAVCLRTKTKRAVRVVIAGNGTLWSKITSLAQQAEQRGVKVEMLGRVNNPLRLFQSADVLLLASDREGTPNVVMEAMSCGLPVVATNVGGVFDLIHDGKTGFIFERNDDARAVSALESLAHNAELGSAVGSRAREFIEKQHSTNLLPGVLSLLYKKILTGI